MQNVKYSKDKWSYLLIANIGEKKKHSNESRGKHSNTGKDMSFYV